MGGALGDVASQLIAGPRFLRRNANALLRMVGGALRERLRTGAGPSAPKTSLNTRMSKERREVAFRRFELQELKALTRALECTINDLALLLCSAATSFKVTAVNGGGESFPSEILSVCRTDNAKATAMIINGFDRTSGPGWIEVPGFSGFLNFLDAGLPDRTSFNFTGYQYDFDPASTFVTNDSPGHGASYADNEAKVIAGNSFDYPTIHGRALRGAGLSFVSASREAVSDTMVSLSQYAMVDLILGKQNATRWQNASMDSSRGLRFYAYPAPLRSRLSEYSTGGGKIFVSGAYTGSEILSTGGGCAR